MKTGKHLSFITVLAAAVLAAVLFIAGACAEGLPLATPTDLSYDYNATLYNEESGKFPGVYETAIEPNTAAVENAPTVGIPSIADANLDIPTLESPAIIQGAAVGYEEKTGPTEYTTIEERPEPYADYRVNIVEEQAQDGSVHKKVTGFDGTYVIARLDVSAIFDAANTIVTQYLHMKQEGNLALIPGMGMTDNNKGFADQTGNKTGAYLLSDLVDQNGTVPYIDVLIFATAKNVAGADAGKENMPDGDIKLQLYVDDIADYNPDLVYDPTSTDPNHATNVLAKFFDTTKVAADAVSRYLLKGSDLALEVAVENSGGEAKDTGTTYWSLEKALTDPYYDLPEDASPEDPGSGRTAKLISEVAVTEGIVLEGTDANDLKKRTLDVNSFDIQVANNTTSAEGTYAESFTLKNAWLTIEDKSNTTGAEMAIGNNAQFVIDQGGKLIIDETCQLEIEWDGATTTPAADGTQPAEPAQPDILNNGLLDLRAGGEIVNNGILTIEGYEGKPIQPGQEQAAEADKGCGELTIEEGATLTNNGSMVVNGKLYNLGTLENNGKYADTIVSNDPDQGLYAYHKGIQISWKDDVTQPNVVPGTLYNGIDRNGTEHAGAKLINNGDIVLNPGTIENYESLQNRYKAQIVVAAATEAIIPVEPPANPDPSQPVIQTKRITLDPPKGSVIENFGTLLNFGRIVPGSVVLNDNGSTGAISTPGDHPELFVLNNSGNIYNFNYIYGMATMTLADGRTLIAEMQAEDGTWLYLYDDRTFVMVLADDTNLTGTYAFEKDETTGTEIIAFATENAAVKTTDGIETAKILPTVQEDGTMEYAFRAASGQDAKFVLDSSFVQTVKEKLEKAETLKASAE